MEAIFQWMFQQQSLGWVLFVATAVGVAALVVFGKLTTGPQIQRDYETWRGLVGSVDRLADAQEQGGQALRDLQASVRNLEEGQRTELHVIQSFQQARDNQ